MDHVGKLRWYGPRLRVGLPEQDIAFRFGISQALVSRILVTWISFLARELSCLIYWPD